jgi:hypothetical protein
MDCIFFQYQKIAQDAVFTPFTQDDFLEQTQFSGNVSGPVLVTLQKNQIACKVTNFGSRSKQTKQK